jgi:hypothetical protein
LAIDVVGDLLQNASLLENDIQLEKQVVLAELSHATKIRKNCSSISSMQTFFRNILWVIRYSAAGSRFSIFPFGFVRLQDR